MQYIYICLIPYLLVGLGGAVGSMMRYALGNWIKSSFIEAWPLGTFVTNITGCLLIGFLYGLHMPDPFDQKLTTRLLLITGFCGGYTTFSSFSLETVLLIKDGNVGLAGGYVIATCFCCILGVYLGLKWA
jgi:fluoride exporter